MYIYIYVYYHKDYWYFGIEMQWPSVIFRHLLATNERQGHQPAHPLRCLQRSCTYFPVGVVVQSDTHRIIGIGGVSQENLLEFNCITFFTMQKLNIAKPVD